MDAGAGQTEGLGTQPRLSGFTLGSAGTAGLENPAKATEARQSVRHSVLQCRT